MSHRDEGLDFSLCWSVNDVLWRDCESDQDLSEPNYQDLTKLFDNLKNFDLIYVNNKILDAQFHFYITRTSPSVTLQTLNPDSSCSCTASDSKVTGANKNIHSRKMTRRDEVRDFFFNWSFNNDFWRDRETDDHNEPSYQDLIKLFDNLKNFDLIYFNNKILDAQYMTEAWWNSYSDDTDSEIDSEMELCLYEQFDSLGDSFPTVLPESSSVTQQ